MNTDVLHKVQLIDGSFTAAEGLDVINSLINEKINFHKLHRLSMCEGNMNSDTSYDDSRVTELIQEKEDFKRIFQEAQASGKRFRINGIIEIEMID